MIGKYLLDREREYEEHLVGKKVVNLVPYTLYTPLFIVLSTEFYAGWQADQANFIANNLDTIVAIAFVFPTKRS